MGFEDARQAMDSQAQTPAASEGQAPESGSSESSPQDAGLAPESASSASQVLDLTKAEKFLWDGKEMTPDELRKSILRQQDYTKKTQAAAEERRRFEQERTQYIREREETEKYESNIDADIEHVLKNPAMADKFKEIYPAKYHAKMEQALDKTFGTQDSPDRRYQTLEQQLKAINGRFQQEDANRARQAFETEVSANAEILESSISRLASKFPYADEDSVLARAEHIAAGIKRDENFNDNFFKTMEKLYQEDHKKHEVRYQEIYKQKVESQKQANVRGRNTGKGGGTPGAVPEKMKLKDVKHHIARTLGQN